MVTFKPQRLPGPWAAGFALDLHTIKSSPYADECGNPQFETLRTEVGELLYRLKYCSDAAAIMPLVETAERFIRDWGIRFSAVVSVPATKRYRKIQPVARLAAEVARRFHVPVTRNAVRKVRETPELKTVTDRSERMRLLDGAFETNVDAVSGRSLLLIDDLYRSGATLRAVTQSLVDAGAKTVYAFAFTRTRTKS